MKDLGNRVLKLEFTTKGVTTMIESVVLAALYLVFHAMAMHQTRKNYRTGVRK